ncbi:hypothetical protein PRZ48_005535 [Zasmidium cellare]|uniref:O-methyltransferase n=1 Tax=Zasmidium cellare TaxID=395010 RepID=A0ABR0EKL9_ZASCE|nr:hypothetical protein PRZ48_005535 [Zasmidium cellare]
MASKDTENGPNADDLLQQLRTIRSSLDQCTSLEDDARRAISSEARALSQDLETPGQILARTLWRPWEILCLKVALDMGLLRILAASQKPRSATDLASLCGVEELFMERLLRCMAAFGTLHETATEEGVIYEANKISRLYATEAGISHMNYVYAMLHRGWYQVPQKLRDNDYRSLTTSTHTVYADIEKKPGSNFWELLTPEQIQTCNTFFPFWNPDHRSWLDIYPAEERFVRDATKDRDAALFVDVGGNTGNQAAAFRRRFPDAPGKVIVQDLEPVLKNAESGIDAIPHDFFTPQPVRGARVYYLKAVMHDWSNDSNVKILSHLRDAMKPGYSKILINEWVIPDHGASRLMAGQDFNLMAQLGGEERSESRHREYIEAAGLKVVGVWDPKDGSTEAVIECEIA